MNLHLWAMVATILLCIEVGVLMLIPGVILFFSIKGMSALHRKMREVSPKVQGVFRQVNQVTHQAADKIAEPVIKVNATTARIQAIGRGTASLLKRHEV